MTLGGSIHALAFGALFARGQIPEPRPGPENSITKASDASEVAPVPAPPPTAWARAGARSWTQCAAFGQEARRAKLGMPNRTAEPDWVAWAALCPHEPEVAIWAARKRLVEVAQLTWRSNGAADDEVESKHQALVADAAAHLERAHQEAERRGQRAPTKARYLAAYVAYVQGDLDAAAQAIAEAQALRDVDRWRIERLGALIAMSRGDLDRALDLAYLAVVGSPFPDRSISRYILAHVLDRVGDWASSRELLRSLRREAGHVESRKATEGVFPLHERLYFRALDHQAHDENSNALWLWNAYLERSEVSDPDRTLALRHRAAVEGRRPPTSTPDPGQ